MIPQVADYLTYLISKKGTLQSVDKIEVYSNHDAQRRDLWLQNLLGRLDITHHSLTRSLTRRTNERTNERTLVMLYIRWIDRYTCFFAEEGGVNRPFIYLFPFPFPSLPLSFSFSLQTHLSLSLSLSVSIQEHTYIDCSLAPSRSQPCRLPNKSSSVL